MTSTHDIINGIPDYMAGHISQNILGRISGSADLVTELNDTSRIEGVLGALSDDEKSLLIDIYALGGEMEWVVFSRIYKDDINKIRELLVNLGSKGLVFQGGLTGRDPIILLPALMERLSLEIFSLKKADISFKPVKVPEIWKHILMINALKTSGLKCRIGLEPFKKGWTQLEEKLDSIMDIRHIYWELSSLGCIKDVNGEIAVLEKPAEALAAEGEVRYALWRFINSCRPYGIDGEVFAALSGSILDKSVLKRIIKVHLARITPPIEGISGLSERLLDEWEEIGILISDVSGGFLKFDDNVLGLLENPEYKYFEYPWRDEAIIQPNMEIIVPRDFRLSDHLNVGEIAELIKADVVSIYSITRQSVLRAAGNGWSAEKIGAFLDRISKHKMPDNINQTITAWISAISCARIITGTFLIASDKEKVPQGLEEIHTGIYRVPDNYEREISSLLQRRGVLVEKEHTSEDCELAWGRLQPVKPVRQPRPSPARGGAYPYGMVIPMPYGSKAIEMMEGFIREGRDIIVFYPKDGYKEICSLRISPVSVYVKSGAAFLEAINEDSGSVDTYEISKIRAILKETLS